MLSCQNRPVIFDPGADHGDFENSLGQTKTRAERLQFQ